jgi:hypothetical protein
MYVVWGQVTDTRSARKRIMQHWYRHAATSSWWMVRNLILQTIEAAATPGTRCERKSQTAPKTTSGMVFSSYYTAPGLSFVAALHSNTKQQRQPHLSPDEQACPATVGEISAQLLWGTTKYLVWTPNVNSSSLNDTFKIVTTVFQQITTEINGVKSEEDRIVAITKLY